MGVPRHPPNYRSREDIEGRLELTRVTLGDFLRQVSRQSPPAVRKLLARFGAQIDRQLWHVVRDLFGVGRILEGLPVSANPGKTADPPPAARDATPTPTIPPRYTVTAPAVVFLDLTVTSIEDAAAAWQRWHRQRSKSRIGRAQVVIQGDAATLHCDGQPVAMPRTFGPAKLLPPPGLPAAQAGASQAAADEGADRCA